MLFLTVPQRRIWSIGDGIHGVALGKAGRPCRREEWQRSGGDLERGDITPFIGAEEFNAVKNLSICHTDLDLGCAFHGVECGKENTIF